MLFNIVLYICSIYVLYICSMHILYALKSIGAVPNRLTGGSGSPPRECSSPLSPLIQVAAKKKKSNLPRFLFIIH